MNLEEQGEYLWRTGEYGSHTITRASSIATRIIKSIDMNRTPIISLNPAGDSIDVSIGLGSKHLLINQPKKEGIPISYYGEDSNTNRKNDTINGTLTEDQDINFLGAWLQSTDSK